MLPSLEPYVCTLRIMRVHTTKYSLCPLKWVTAPGHIILHKQPEWQNIPNSRIYWQLTNLNVFVLSLTEEKKKNVSEISEVEKMDIQKWKAGKEKCFSHTLLSIGNNLSDHSRDPKCFRNTKANKIFWCLKNPNHPASSLLKNFGVTIWYKKNTIIDWKIS